MARRRKNKALRIFLIIVGSVVAVAGIFIAIYISILNRSLTYYEVNLTENSGVLNLSTNSKKLAPNSDIVSRAITVNITTTSSDSYIRAKVVFENDSDDNRVLSFVNQLNFYVKDIKTARKIDYSWKYFEEDNAFYLMSSNSDILKIVNKKDNNYIFSENLTVPSSIEQISSLNSDGENVQIGEDITIKVIFECIQSSLNLNSAPKISNVREYFNNFSTYNEGRFTSCNGYLTSYSGNDEYLTLPKYVGEDYILGIKKGAFNNFSIKTLIIPGNYIYIEDNAFTNVTNLNFVSLKNHTKIKLNPNSFAAKSSLEIYTPESMINYLSDNYGTFNYYNCIKQYSEITETDITKIDKSIVYLYAPNVIEFTGIFENFNSLKVIYAPSLTKVNASMFNGLVGLIDVDCPNVTTIENGAFTGCTGLVNASFSDKLDSIGEYSFANCSKLKNIDFTKSLKVIPKQAFRNCSAVNNVVFNAENIEILTGAFYNSSNLKSVIIKSLSKIEDYAFGECQKLKYFMVDNTNNLSLTEKSFANSTNVNIIGYITFIFNNESVKSAMLAQNEKLNCLLLSVNKGELVKCSSNLKNIDLSEFSGFVNITKIGTGLFKNNTTIQTLILPSSVTAIGNNFVEGAINLKQIIIDSYNPPKFSEKAFEGVENLSIYVPEINKDLYKEILSDFNVKVIGK